MEGDILKLMKVIQTCYSRNLSNCIGYLFQHDLRINALHLPLLGNLCRGGILILINFVHISSMFRLNINCIWFCCNICWAKSKWMEKNIRNLKEKNPSVKDDVIKYINIHFTFFLMNKHLYMFWNCLLIQNYQWRLCFINIR